MAIAQHELTLEDFLRLPEDKPALEFEEGRVTQKVSPKGPHSRLQYTTLERINTFASPRRLALAFPELRVTFGGRSYVPDISVYRWARIPRTSEGKIAHDFSEPPDITVEIVSPGQSVNSLVRRSAWYVRHGVQVALLLDPDDESVAVIRPDATPTVLRAIEPLDLGDVLPGFHLTVGELFDALRLD